MTDKQKVLSVYPDAKCAQRYHNGFGVFYQIYTKLSNSTDCVISDASDEKTAWSKAADYIEHLNFNQ